MKEFSRFLSTNSLIKKDVSELHLFDGDVVEKKNLSRQAFMEEDIGRNKASVMSEVLNYAFGLNYICHPSYIISKEDLRPLLESSKYCMPVVVMCVDNHACRLLVEELFDELPNMVVLDSANEFDTGEVVFSLKRDGVVYGPCRSYYFPDIKEADLRNRDKLSCEELNNSAPQHIFTNMYAGQILSTALANFFEQKLYPGYVFFNTFKFQSEFVPFVRLSREGESDAKK